MIPHLNELVAEIRYGADRDDFNHELKVLINEILRELKFIEQQQRVYDNLKKKRDEKHG